MPTARYTYRIRPGKQAERALLGEWNRCRFVWNMCVGRDAELRSEGIRPTGSTMCKELTDWRSRFDWLAEGSSVAQQQMIRNWYSTRQASFKVPGRGRPKFKSFRTASPSLNYTRSAFSITDRRLCVVGGSSIPVVWSRELPSIPSSVGIFRDAVGDWWASFVVQVEDVALPNTDQQIGIDWGLKAVATATDPDFDLPHNAHARKAQEKLTKYQRMMARRKPSRGQTSSNGYQQAKKRTAKLHRKVRWQRADAAKKWAVSVVAAHDQIAVEDFKPKFMAANRKLARTAADASVGVAKRELLQRAERAGRTVVLVPPAYTSMKCAECGKTKAKRLELSERTFHCDHCGHTACRDRNAARTILATAGFNRVCVEDVRPEPLVATAV